MFAFEDVLACAGTLALFEFALTGLLPVVESLLQPTVSAKKSISARASGAIERALL